ncbi:molybdenum cofactor biosynthesis protein MoaD [Sphingobium sp. C100]|jgi:sulfur-carrier protein|uniref:MoaD/ThiS family protein n=1 Tax=Sphingobium sp. C100 TaxID=1207055 RepID=UPI0003D6882E|nr:MoaD/ThiS family protein [Sphingobium sp. C100]ETI63907.1 molybdenum cofactor biosynthesis protein MoaD [Sphingobium sp. C100]PHQ63282.1 MAG: molybdopterin synthase sulfur carrier subunit [Sphingobium sp.]
MGPLTIVYFAWVREAIGRDQDVVDHPGPGATLADLVAMLAGRGGGYAQALGDSARLRAAIDQQFAPLDTMIGDAREVAIFPPVTGG